MFYSLCQKWNTKGANGRTVWNSIGCSSTRLDVVVVWHKTSVMHEEAISLELRTEANINTALKKLNDKKFAALIDAQKVLYYLIEHNLPIHTLYKLLIELCIRLGATNLPNLSKSGNAHYTRSRIVDEFLDCQSEVVQEKVGEKVKEVTPMA